MYYTCNYSYSDPKIHKATKVGTTSEGIVYTHNMNLVLKI